MSIPENLDIRVKKFWPKDGPSVHEIPKYIKKYSKEKIVIKCGGRVLLDPELFKLFIDDITILKKLGLTPVVVHGGGPRIKKKLDQLGKKHQLSHLVDPESQRRVANLLVLNVLLFFASV